MTNKPINLVQRSSKINEISTTETYVHGRQFLSLCLFLRTVRDMKGIKLLTRR